ncbi:uncharacterized protein QYS62_011489 [Fusarium acuminatum]|uniref:MYND-type domain-containing protein n=1 Tax=Fusarium acuminatum TaxID=5515 RepID=A0ABZ2XCT7_9HYPO
MDTDTERISVESTLKELHAYAKLLFLRSGRQFENKALYQELEDEVSLDESGNDSSSSKNVPLGNLDTDHLRRKFLDRLSETVSSMKGGRHVVASHMFYWPDKIKVFVAINSGFAEGDALSRFLDNLCESLKGIAAAPDDETEKHTDALWNLLLHHQSSRLNATIVNLRQNMKNLHHLLPQRSSSELTGSSIIPDIDGTMFDFEDCLKLLAQLLFGEGDSGLERHDSLVVLSYALYRTFPAEKFQALGRQGEKLHREIGFLGRLQMSFHVLVVAARQISGFDSLSLIPVVNPKTRKKPSSPEWSLAKTFNALKIQVSDTAIDKLMGPSSSKVKWTKNKLITDFSRLKSPTWEVHAEIQLIVFTLSHPNDIANGKRFLDRFQGLKTRGCHGKLYNHSWTLPPGDNLGKDEQQALYGAAIGVISWMRKKLIRSTMVPAQRRPEVKESTIGGSLISMLGTSQEGHQQGYAISEHLHRQRAQNLYRQSNQKSLLYFVRDGKASGVEVRDSTLLKSTMGFCTRCYEETTRRCSHCREGLFCGEDCERKMPLSHLLKCNMRQVTSADYLFEDVLWDTIPADPQVRQDYWLEQCHNNHEESHLFGVFVGLFKYCPDPITRETLHQWRSDPGGNTYLVARIAEKFEELPKGNTGDYFPWFLRHRKRFELSAGHETIPRAPSPMTQVRNLRAKAQKYLALEDQNKDIMDLTPFSKMHCFAFYSMTIGNQYPPPMNQVDCHWFDFGFVVCRDKHDETLLSRMYNNMLFGSTSQLEYAESLKSSTLAEIIKKRDPACTFDEFWKAWDKGKLMTIFNKYWPAVTTQHAYQPTEYSILDRLHKFIEAETPRPSIWKLRHFLALEDVSVESAVPDIAWATRDYGFSENLDTRMTMELRNFYMQLFEKTEPMETHRERMEGNLVQFAQRHVNCVTLRIKELLQDL